jgi:DNA polymerase I-like protein with 3'-5' exonuclease and polymerase domains
VLAFDTETTGLNPYAADFRVFMVQWADAFGEHLCTEDEGWDRFLAAIEHEDVLVAANASFDIHALREAGIVDLLESGHRVHDVTTLARVCVPGRYTYKLEALGDDILGGDSTVAQRELKEAAKLSAYSQRIAGMLMGLPWRLVKSWSGVSWTQKDKEYYSLWRLEPELMEKYGKEDVRLAYDLWCRIWSRALPSDIEVYRMEIAEVAPLLRAAERDGVLVDVARLGELEDRLTRERDELRDKLLMGGLSEAALGAEVEGDEDDDADAPAEYAQANAKALRDDLLGIGIPLYKLTPSSGEPSKRNPEKINPEVLAVNKDALREFEVAFPVVRDLLDWRNRCKILKTYIGALREADPRVHTSFSQAAARTSRMASSKPNMQNLPTPEEEKEGQPHVLGVRDVLIPAPGNSFIAADFDSVEVRALAHYIADDGLTALLDAGVDFHQQTALKVAQSRCTQCADAAARRACPHLVLEDFVKGGPRDKQRTKAKVTTFTAMYGGGARLLATRLGISVEEAAQIKHETLNSIPGYWDLEERLKAAVRRRGFPHVVTICGRRLHVPRDKDYVALNTLVQGTSAELMKLAMVKAAPVAARFGYAIRLVVHDELLLEGPTACVEEAQAAIVTAMESCYPLSPRLLVSANNSTLSYGGSK